jgi:hypothetical protein
VSGGSQPRRRRTQLWCLTRVLRHEIGLTAAPQASAAGAAGQHLTPDRGAPKLFPTCQYTMLGARFVIYPCMIRFPPYGWVYLE